MNFAAVSESFSEVSRRFEWNGIVSNESSLGLQIEILRLMDVQGGAYIGVGTEQNFSLIAATKPDVAFIVDIRREVRLIHLVYKALFHFAEDRRTFLSLWLSRPLSSRLSPDIGAEELVASFYFTPSARTLFESTYARVIHMIDAWGMRLSEGDRRYIRNLLDTFKRYGLRTSSMSWLDRRVRSVQYSLESLLLLKNSAGEVATFLADEDSYGSVRMLHLQNRIIPVTGDFGARNGALKSIADFLYRNNIPLSVFYASNVEYYLMGGDTFDYSEESAFIENLSRFPRGKKFFLLRGYRNAVYDAGYLFDHISPDDIHASTFYYFGMPELSVSDGTVKTEFPYEDVLYPRDTPYIQSWRVSQ